MCGIVGYTGAQEAAPLLLDGLRKLEYRGYDSAGIAVEKDGVLRMIKASGQITNLAEKIRDGKKICIDSVHEGKRSIRLQNCSANSDKHHACRNAKIRREHFF